MRDLSLFLKFSTVAVTHPDVRKEDKGPARNHLSRIEGREEQFLLRPCGTWPHWLISESASFFPRLEWRGKSRMMSRWTINADQTLGVYGIHRTAEVFSQTQWALLLCVFLFSLFFFSSLNYTFSDSLCNIHVLTLGKSATQKKYIYIYSQWIKPHHMNKAG